jgi:DNA-directed RNA polymerase specialized sigma24 family protein
MSAPEIAEELGWSVGTIRQDLSWLNSQVEKIDDPEMLQEYMQEAMVNLMDHETRDLRDADRENDEKAKHRAKQSYRSSLKMMDELFGDAESETADEGSFEELSEDVQDSLSEFANDEIERVLTE